MIVTCDNCQVKYNLGDDKVVDDGIKVRCKKCKHMWLLTQDGNVTLEEGDANLKQEPESIETETKVDQETEKPLEEEDKKEPDADTKSDAKKKASSKKNINESVSETKTGWIHSTLTGFFLKLNIFIMIILTGFEACVLYYPYLIRLPVFSTVYSAFEVEPTDNLVLGDLDIEVIDDEDANKIVLLSTGTITNLAKTERYISPLRIKLYDQDHHLVATLPEYKFNYEKLDHLEKKEFNIRFYYRVDHNVKSIEFAIGNKIDLWLL